ncbi:MAG: hypothetical protein QMC67_16535 [Candidatus Wallbacteria bacterium]
MNKIFYYLMAVVSIFFILLSLIFLISSMAKPSYIIVALSLGGIGAGILYFALAGISYANFTNADNIANYILKIAHRNNGVFTKEEIKEKLNINEEIFNLALKKLENQSALSINYDNGLTIYKISGIANFVKRKCEFCATEFNVRDNLVKCPNCGGNIKIS